MDNWIDITSLIVQEIILPGSIPKCNSGSTNPTIDVNDDTHRILFGSNNTVLVGLTETMFASTDGYHAIYYSKAKGGVVESEIAPDAWPIAVDVRMGIAAVAYSDIGTKQNDDVAHGQTTSMLGCRCDDDDNANAIKITCAILEYDLVENATTTASQSVFPVIFQVPTTSEYLTCSTVKISIESVRWPHMRFTAPERPSLPLLNLLKGSSCLETGTCTMIDAAIWVVPLCGDGSSSPVCIEAFTKAACYPYCLGVRQTGSFNSIVRLYNARNWWDRVHIFNRDCAFHQYSSSSDAQEDGFSIQLQELPSIFSTNYGGLTQNLIQQSSSSLQQILPENFVETIIPFDWINSAFINIRENDITNVNCVPQNLARSTIPKTAAPSGDYGSENFRSVLGEDQPFVVAGDTVLTSKCEEQNNDFTAIECTISVYRIYGNDFNQMTLVNTNNQLPALAPPTTPSMLEDVVAKGSNDKITLPYSLTNHPWTQNPAAATEDAIFFAVNPYWQIFESFIQYCNDPTEQGRLQLVPISSFSPITLWRIYPYVYCSPAQGKLFNKCCPKSQEND